MTDRYDAQNIEKLLHDNLKSNLKNIERQMITTNIFETNRACIRVCDSSQNIPEYLLKCKAKHSNLTSICDGDLKRLVKHYKALDYESKIVNTLLNTIVEF